MRDSVARLPLLQQMINWEREVTPVVPDLETPTGYFLQFDPQDNGGYTCSPVDSIMFARTGMDGIHYSLVTDFGAVTNLAEAPVIRVSPMDFGECVRLVAANIRDFFALSLFGHEGLLLNDFPTNEAYLAYLREQEQQETTEYFDADKWKRQKAVVREKAVQEFAFQPIEDAFSYVQEVRAKRSKEIVLRTSDDLGIVALTPGEGTKAYTPHPWRGQDISRCRLEEVQAFVQTAERETLLSFIRDCQEQHVDNPEFVQLLHMALKKHGWHLEAARLLSCMHVDKEASNWSTGSIHVSIDCRQERARDDD